MTQPSLIAQHKQALRRTMQQRRTALSAGERAHASAAASARLTSLPELGAAVAERACIAGYAATPIELDPAPALADLSRGGGRVAYPRVTTGTPRLRLHVGDPGGLLPGRFGILEPDVAWPEVSPDELAVVIVPGLAFDGRGRRLGFGGGYYDELLGSLPSEKKPFVVGLGYDFQVVDDCPAEAHDAHLDAVVTEARVLRCQGPAAGVGAAKGGTP
jgi:5-formyltetrahydrofolate cyclo-ligase